MAIVLSGLAFMIRFVHLPEINESISENTFDKASIKPSVFHYPQLVLGVIALFFYVGVEVIAADTIIQFGQSQGFDLETAKIFASYTLIAMVVGYIIGIISIPKYIKQETALAISALLGIIFTVLALITEGYASIMCIAILGFANAIMWPAIWPLAINGLGKYTKIGSALLIMAIVGGATLPLVYGYLADLENVGRQLAYWIMAPLYVYIFFYAFKGHKYRIW
jgi:fucose permease